MSKNSVRVAVAQINCTVGDLEENTSKIKEYLSRAKNEGADIICFPELALTGYPPEDLLIKPEFISDNLQKLQEIAASADKIIAVVGFVDRTKEGIYNAAAVIYEGKIKGIYRKMHLPNYSVFDEKRYFIPGVEPLVFKYGGFIFGVNICEDIWHAGDPIKKQAALGAECIININSSPYYAGKSRERERIICAQAKDNAVAVVYANLVGAQDELVFDGQSMVVGSKGEPLASAHAFQEELLVVDIDFSAQEEKTNKAIVVSEKANLKPDKSRITNTLVKPLEKNAEIYRALMLGLSDYVEKNGFKKVAVGLSGGVDSSLVAALAVDALGKDNVTGVYMPSRFSSKESEEDAKQLAENLGIRLMTISIEQTYKMYLMVLEPYFEGFPKNIAEENLQARIRGNILMALSNKFGWLILATGNKSEMSTGYATLYGDMAGGLAVIKDVSKTLVYTLVGYRNCLNFVIPERVITKEPTAELKMNQKDSDTLPVYAVLDPILRAYVEEDKEPEEITAMGFDKDTVLRVMSMVDKNEYKRRQSPLGIKITPKALGRDRRMPITNRYRG